MSLEKVEPELGHRLDVSSCSLVHRLVLVGDWLARESVAGKDLRLVEEVERTKRDALSDAWPCQWKLSNHIWSFLFQPYNKLSSIFVPPSLNINGPQQLRDVCGLSYRHIPNYN
jgi:hypothetical protein